MMTRDIMKRLVLLLFLFVLSCDGEPLLTSLTTTDIKLVYLGTYASNNPRPWWDGQSIDPAELRDDSATHTVPEDFPSFILPDIAEVRINGSKFALKRSYVNVGLVDDHPLFDGRGVSVECNDLEDGRTFSTLQVYFRKLVYGSAKKYDNSWNYTGDLTEQFGNSELGGYDVIQHLKYIQTEVDEDTESNLVFPLSLEIFPTYRHERKNKYVIEFRYVIKNNVKYYEFYDEDDDVFISYFAPGDFTTDVKEGDDYIGGNLIGGVYIYDPEKTVTISGTAPAGTYVAAITSEDSIENYTGGTLIPPRATWCADGTYILENVMAGYSYKLYYSVNTPSAANAEFVSEYTGEQTVSVDASQSGETITINL